MTGHFSPRGWKPCWKRWSASPGASRAFPVRNFRASAQGIDRMDAICMILIAAGEEFKNIDRKTEGTLFSRYPGIDWRGAIGLRDVMAHGYFDVDTEELFNICRDYSTCRYRRSPSSHSRTRFHSTVAREIAGVGNPRMRAFKSREEEPAPAMCTRKIQIVRGLIFRYCARTTGGRARTRAARFASRLSKVTKRLVPALVAACNASAKSTPFS